MILFIFTGKKIKNPKWKTFLEKMFRILFAVNGKSTIENIKRKNQFHGGLNATKKGSIKKCINIFGDNWSTVSKSINVCDRSNIQVHICCMMWYVSIFVISTNETKLEMIFKKSFQMLFDYINIRGLFSSH